MRVAEMNLGQDSLGKVIGSYIKWNRAHDYGECGSIKGLDSIHEMIDRLREDGYKGIQALLVTSETTIFGGISKRTSSDNLVKIVGEHKDLTVYIK